MTKFQLLHAGVKLMALLHFAQNRDDVMNFFFTHLRPPVKAAARLELSSEILPSGST